MAYGPTLFLRLAIEKEGGHRNMQARVTSSGRDIIQLTMDAEAACAIAASIRFASRFHETFQRLLERIVEPMELAARNSECGVRGREGANCRT